MDVDPTVDDIAIAKRIAEQQQKDDKQKPCPLYVGVLTKVDKNGQFFRVSDAVRDAVAAVNACSRARVSQTALGVGFCLEMCIGGAFGVDERLKKIH